MKISKIDSKALLRNIFKQFFNLPKIVRKFFFIKCNFYMYQRKIAYWQWIFLYPLSLIFKAISRLRYQCYKINILKSEKVSVPVIIVGNINSGGTGKTPLVIWLCHYYKNLGYQPGIVTRGYGNNFLNSSSPNNVYLLNQRTYNHKNYYPDEAHLCWLSTNVPIAIAKNRVKAAKQLIDECSCNIIIADDGLQHYALKRDFEIAVIDYEQAFGNRHLLPLGPLRESLYRLKTVDEIVVYCQSLSNQNAEIAKEWVINGMEQENIVKFSNPKVNQCAKAFIYPEKIKNLKIKNYTVETSFFYEKKIYVIAGIGNPEKFFKLIKQLIPSKQCQFIIFPDHFCYKAKDFFHFSDGEIIMTEKDGVKCLNFCQKNFWILPIRLSLQRFNPPHFLAMQGKEP